MGKAVSEWAVSATTVAKGVANDVMYLNAWWRSDPTVAKAVAANYDKDGTF